MENKRLVIVTLIVQVFLTWISLHKDITTIGLKGILVFPLFVTFWAITSALILIFSKKQNIKYVSRITFTLISGINILILLFISLSVILGGPLRQEGLIFLVFPIYGFFVFLAGIILGSIIYYIKNENLKSKNKKMKNKKKSK